ncbi:anaerobic dimethyl sulfoxide reductase maturation protein (twin-arginine leader-binding protein) [Escherichia coli]|uniref:Anaerobic dimethyl sulfoxide reductase maturation protein (Twin-arginine leader-binding protein) n=1 Tax=Escherichia coli TaxID=562 RepID=A0A377CIL6_ECOLX|nr:anaerobic dimethyl sulfoxide reductase maturation protein (twin-arginine leader-binding protein) [Escherichia coli]
MTHFSQQDIFSVAARVLGALFYYAPESAEAAPLVAVLTSDAGKLSGLYQKRH